MINMADKIGTSLVVDFFPQHAPKLYEIINPKIIDTCQTGCLSYNIKIERDITLS